MVHRSDEEFTAFVRVHGRALARTATLLAGDRVAGEDLLQTALAQTYARWRKADIEDLEQYVRVVLARAQISWRRRLSSTERPLDLEPDELPVPDIADRTVDRRVLLGALQQLPPKQRATLVLRYFDDLSEADTAKALGCSAGSVKQHSTRGLAKLRALLGPDAVLAGL
ncbi:MAG: SigE family polymerase sigma factor [Frankiales bacterium]|nr:SigE family polymerase sigma factor [Frankiales bacterium]